MREESRTELNAKRKIPHESCRFFPCRRFCARCEWVLSARKMWITTYTLGKRTSRGKIRVCACVCVCTGADIRNLHRAQANKNTAKERAKHSIMLLVTFSMCVSSAYEYIIDDFSRLTYVYYIFEIFIVDAFEIDLLHARNWCMAYSEIFFVIFVRAEALFSYAKPCIQFQVRTKPANACHSPVCDFKSFRSFSSCHARENALHIHPHCVRPTTKRQGWVPKSVCIHWARIPGRQIASSARYAVRVSVSYWNCYHCKLVMHIERMRTYAAHQCP